MCRKDPSRLDSKLDLDIEEDNFNIGFDPEKEQEDAFMLIQETLIDDYSMLERQNEFLASMRCKALQEQRQLLKYTAKQDRYYNNILANWNHNPQNQILRRPEHLRLRKRHNTSYFRLYDFNQDNDPPRYEEAHWHEQALSLMDDGM